MIVNPMIDILAISAILSIGSTVLRSKFIDQGKMKEQQKEIKEKQAKMKDLIGKQDQKSKNELEALEKEVLEAMNTMLSSSTKVMMFSMVLFLPAFFLMGLFYEKAIIDLPIALPWFNSAWNIWDLGTYANFGIQIYQQTNWFGWYFASYLLTTIVITIGQKVYKTINGGT